MKFIFLLSIVLLSATLYSQKSNRFSKSSELEQFKNEFSQVVQKLGIQPIALQTNGLKCWNGIATKFTFGKFVVNKLNEEAPFTEFGSDDLKNNTFIIKSTGSKLSGVTVDVDYSAVTFFYFFKRTGKLKCDIVVKAEYQKIIESQIRKNVQIDKESFKCRAAEEGNLFAAEDAEKINKCLTGDLGRRILGRLQDNINEVVAQL